MNAELTPLRSFVLPGGSAAAAALHVARTVCRRAERAWSSSPGCPMSTSSAPALKYINRLSDLLFVASRYVNAAAATATYLWVPGAKPLASTVEPRACIVVERIAIPWSSSLSPTTIPLRSIRFQWVTSA